MQDTYLLTYFCIEFHSVTMRCCWCSTNESLLDTRRCHHRYHSYHNRDHVCQRINEDHPRRRRSSWWNQ